ncbi:MAG: FABP family protein [Euzebyales bacterium]|nr:FABP family protein [Euzebyales bacterium]
MIAPLHPALAPLAFLLGVWEGEGAGEYPTIAGFGYREQVTFAHVGKPFLAYAQRTWATDDGRPLHSESGYWRSLGDGGVELTMAHPTGVVELATGRAEATSVQVRSIAVLGAPTAKPVEALERDLTVDGDTLTYAVRMAAVGVPLTHHLAATLQRRPA